MVLLGLTKTSFSYFSILCGFLSALGDLRRYLPVLADGPSASSYAMFSSCANMSTKQKFRVARRAMVHPDQWVDLGMRYHNPAFIQLDMDMPKLRVKTLVTQTAKIVSLQDTSAPSLRGQKNGSTTGCRNVPRFPHRPSLQPLEHLLSAPPSAPLDEPHNHPILS
jgi:hypothetical protein